jgi:hypothetical protein
MPIELDIAEEEKILSMSKASFKINRTEFASYLELTEA